MKFGIPTYFLLSLSFSVQFSVVSLHPTGKNMSSIDLWGVFSLGPYKFKSVSVLFKQSISFSALSLLKCDRLAARGG